MRDTSFPLTIPLPDLSEKFDFEFNAFTKSEKVNTLGLLCLGFCFVIKKIPSKILYSVEMGYYSYSFVAMGLPKNFGGFP